MENPYKSPEPEIKSIKQYIFNRKIDFLFFNTGLPLPFVALLLSLVFYYYKSYDIMYSFLYITVVFLIFHIVQTIAKNELNSCPDRQEIK